MYNSYSYTWVIVLKTKWKVEFKLIWFLKMSSSFSTMSQKRFFLRLNFSPANNLDMKIIKYTWHTHHNYWYKFPYPAGFLCPEVVADWKACIGPPGAKGLVTWLRLSWKLEGKEEGSVAVGIKIVLSGQECDRKSLGFKCSLSSDFGTLEIKRYLCSDFSLANKSCIVKDCSWISILVL